MLLTPTLLAAEFFNGRAYYLGDPHAHTGVSGDGGSQDLGNCFTECGSLGDALWIARENNLDWVAFPDHINGNPASDGYPISDPDQYNTFFQEVLAADSPGEFVTIPAAEVWFVGEDGLDSNSLEGPELGHKTLMFFGTNQDLQYLTMAALQFNEISMEITDCEGLHQWATRLGERFGPLITAPHHPAAVAPMVTDWSCFDPAFEPVVEVYSEHGNSLWRSEIFDPMHNGFDAEHSVETALNPNRFGLRFGFIGGTDSHDTNPGGVCTLDQQRISHGNAGGLTIAVLPEDQDFTRYALYEAMRKRSTYVTTGPLVPLSLGWYSLDTHLGGLGQEITLPEGQPLKIVAQIPEDLDPWVVMAQAFSPGGTTPLLHTGSGSWELELDYPELEAYYYVGLAMDGTRVYPAGCDDGGNSNVEWIWSSPSWINSVEGDLDGDGSSWSEGDCAEGNPEIGPDLEEIWYDGIDQDCDGNDSDQDEDGVPGLPAGGTDCNDQDPEVFPGADEIWYDGIDQDCNGNDGDQDEDGFLSTLVGGEDCDDSNPEIWPGAPDVWYDGIDFACDGEWDQDGDGVVLNADCDDQDPGVQLCLEPPASGCMGQSQGLPLGFLLAWVVRMKLPSRLSSKQ
jgi:hypothetical protein